MRPSRLHLVLGGGCAVLVAAIVAIEAVPDPTLLGSQPEHVDAAPAAPFAPAPDAPEALADLRSRPPFWADRHVPVPAVIPVAAIPAPPPPPPPAPPPPPNSELTLVGIVNGPEGRIAILRLRSSGKLERHVEGDAVVKWGLKKILADRVVLIGGGVESELGFPPPAEWKSASSPGAPSTGFPRVPSQPLPLPPR